MSFVYSRDGEDQGGCIRIVYYCLKDVNKYGNLMATVVENVGTWLGSFERRVSRTVWGRSSFPKRSLFESKTGKESYEVRS